MRKIFDVHLHLSEDKDDALIRYAWANGLTYTLDELLDMMKKNGIQRGLLLSPPLHVSGCVPNEQILALSNRSSETLSPVVTVDPPIGKVKEAVKFARENRKKIRAFKIRLGYVKATADDRVFDRVYDYAEAERLPVLFHTGDTASSAGDLAAAHPLSLDKLANKRERLTIVLCHFGNPWFDDVAELMYKHPNVYTDTSGLITGGHEYEEKYSDWLARRVSEAIYYVGSAEKVLFGTDYPVTKHADALALIRKLDISELDKEKIFLHNAERLFGP